MYNGVGLASARGSGTSGHISRNLSHLKSPGDHASSSGRSHLEKQEGGRGWRERAREKSKHSHEILEHELRRKAEMECLNLQDRLEDEGVAEDEIIERVSKLRTSLRASLSRTDQEGRISKSSRQKWKPHQVHEIAHAKELENHRMARALGISEETRPAE